MTRAAKQLDSVGVRVVAATYRGGVDTRGPAGLVHMSWDTLRAAAYQDDAGLSAVYSTMLAEARRMAWRGALSEAHTRIASCPGHTPIRSVDRVFDGPVSRDENRAAHGNIVTIDTCRCGAQRRTNVNGRHVEEGPWHLDDSTIAGEV